MKNRSTNITLYLAALLILMLPASSAAQDGRTVFTDSHLIENVLEIGRLQVESDVVPLAQSVDLEKGQVTAIAEFDLSSVFEHQKILGEYLPPIEVSLSGRVENRSDVDAIVNFYLEPASDGLDPEGRKFVGTIFVRAGSSIKIRPSDRFEKNLFERLADQAALEDRDTAVLSAKVLAKGNAKIHLSKLSLHKSPVFHAAFLVDNSPDRPRPQSTYVSNATLAGEITNTGKKELKVALVLGIEDSFDVDYSEGLIAYGEIQPKETEKFYDMMLEGAQQYLRQAMTESAFGEPIRAHLLVFSDEPIKMKSKELILKTEVSYR